MMGKWMSALGAGLLAAALFAAGENAEAARLMPAAKKVLADNIEYHPVRGEQVLQMGPYTIHYRGGELVLHRNSGMISIGYILHAAVPDAYMEEFRPWFDLNLTEKEWKGLSQFNMDFYDPESAGRKGVEALLEAWAAAYVHGAAPDNTIEVTEIEPLRRMDERYGIIYTLGARFRFQSERFELPLFGRLYFFRQGGHLQVMAMFTSDGGRYPLMYAADDLARYASLQGLQQDIDHIAEHFRERQNHSGTAEIQ